MPHICVRELGQHWFRSWLVAWSTPSQYLNKCWKVVNWAIGNKFQWNFNQNSNIGIQENAFEYVVCEMVAILSRGYELSTSEVTIEERGTLATKHNKTQQTRADFLGCYFPYFFPTTTHCELSFLDGFVATVWWCTGTKCMMTSSNGNIFRVTGHLCGEFTGPRWIPRTKASDAELWCVLLSAPEYTAE